MSGDVRLKIRSRERNKRFAVEEEILGNPEKNYDKIFLLEW